MQRLLQLVRVLCACGLVDYAVSVSVCCLGIEQSVMGVDIEQ